MKKAAVYIARPRVRLPEFTIEDNVEIPSSLRDPSGPVKTFLRMQNGQSFKVQEELYPSVISSIRSHLKREGLEENIKVVSRRTGETEYRVWRKEI